MPLQFARISLCQPELKVGNPEYNLDCILQCINSVDSSCKSDIIVFPELSIVGYTCDDLFHNADLLASAQDQILRLVKYSESYSYILVVGAPLRTKSGLYNCAFLIRQGKILCAVPKCYLPNYSEYYEKRYFDSGLNICDPPEYVRLTEYEFPLTYYPIIELFAANSDPILFTIEICEDLWAPFPPSQVAVAHGASLVINLSASNALNDKDKTRRQIISDYTLKNNISYAYCAASKGEAVNDLVWDGHCIIATCGRIVYENDIFHGVDKTIHTQDVDIGISLRKKIKNKTNSDNYRYIRELIPSNTRPFSIPVVADNHRGSNQSSEHQLVSIKPIRFPFAGSNDLTISSATFNFVINAQVQALYQRYLYSGVKRFCLGVSGGLDSTHVLLVIDNLIKKYQLDKDTLVPVVMPSSVSSDETQASAIQLIKALGYKPRVIPINDSVELMLGKLGRADNPHEIQDITYENVQAGERTSILFRLANQEHAFVVGTSDLSELSLGWCTYGVGDHMSHYSLNVGLPKTLIQASIRHFAFLESTPVNLATILANIVSRKISPELVSHNSTGTLQDTESYIGPYPVIDFLLYHYLDSQPPLSYLHTLCHLAFNDSSDIGINSSDVERAFRSFSTRFFSSQFKRTAIPNGPKLFSSGSLSPRGDWRIPVDHSFPPDNLLI